MNEIRKKSRSEIMRSVRQKGTAPEQAVAEILAEIGVKELTQNDKRLPGAPDFTDTERKIALFIHGCFWHRHEGCKKSTTPKSNHDFWQKKFNQNIQRDKRCENEVKELGWRVEVIWECEAKNRDNLLMRLENIFNNSQ
ncbi:very short patch repair endonuclease [Azospirillum melinis]